MNCNWYKEIFHAKSACRRAKFDGGMMTHMVCVMSLTTMARFLLSSPTAILLPKVTTTVSLCLLTILVTTTVRATPDITSFCLFHNLCHIISAIIQVYYCLIELSKWPTYGLC